MKEQSVAKVNMPVAENTEAKKQSLLFSNETCLKKTSYFGNLEKYHYKVSNPPSRLCSRKITPKELIDKVSGEFIKSIA